VEFLVDDPSGTFFFLEMNTRIQVEHGVTEEVFGSLQVDIVELMILQGIAELSESSVFEHVPNSLLQERYATVPGAHSIEARVYAENPAEAFRPSPGILQLVQLWEDPCPEWLRIDTWVHEIFTTFTKSHQCRYRQAQSSPPSSILS